MQNGGRSILIVVPKTGQDACRSLSHTFADDSTELEVPERELRLDDARDIDSKVEIGGFVFYDADGSGRFSRGDRVLPGMTVQVLDTTGAVMATTKTDGFGHYQFSDLDLETYRIRVGVPFGAYQTTDNPEDFEITKGTIEPLVNFGLNLLRNRNSRT